MEVAVGGQRVWKGEKGTTWMFVQGPPVPSFAIVHIGFAMKASHRPIWELNFR